jgi:RND family efflux transporter MFP subunit
VTDQLSSDLASLRIDRSPQARRWSAKRIGFVVGFIAGTAIVVYFGMDRWKHLQAQLFKQEMRTTEVSVISPSQAEVQVTATGYVIPQLESKVGAKQPGRLQKVFVKEGDDVKEGQIIAQLEDSDAKSAVVVAGSRVGVAQARVATARANLTEISQQVEREKGLVASGAVGRANLDDLVARQKAQEEQIRAAETEVHSAQADVGSTGVGLKDRVVIAPISGRIVSKPAAVGEFVGGFGTVGQVAEIVDFSSLMVETDVPESRLHLVKLGGPAEIVLDAYPNKRYRGIAQELGQRVNRSKATVIVKVKFADDITGVLPEMSARVSFLAKAITDEALKEAPKRVVLAESIVEREGKKVVFVVDSGKLHAVQVKAGGPVGSSVELIDGPPPGTKVVASPTVDTQDGQSIKETDK